MAKLDTTFTTVNDTNFDNTSAFDDDDFPLPSKLISDELALELFLLNPFIRLVLLPFGLWANAVVIRTFLRMGLNDSVTIAFFALTVSNFCSVVFGFVTIPFYFISYLGLKKLFFFKVAPVVIESYLLSLNLGSNIIATYVTTFLAMQRCLCIVRPLHFKGMMTKKKTWWMIAAFIPFPIIHLAIAYPSTRVLPHFNPYWNMSQLILIVTPRVQLFIANRTLFFFVYPCVCQVLTAGCVIVMKNKLMSSAKFRKSVSESQPHSGACVDATHNRNPGKRKEDKEVMGLRERTAIVQVTFISTLFLFTNLFKIVYCVLGVAVPQFQVTGLYHNVHDLYMAVMFGFDYMNASVNFLIYYKYNSRFRELCFKSSKA